MRKRVLTFGMSDRRGGTESAIESFAGELKARGFSFDFVCEEPLACNTPATQDSRCFVVPAKRMHPCKYFAAMHSLFRDHSHEYDAIWVNLNSLSNIDALVYAKRHHIQKRIAHVHSGRFLAKSYQKVLSSLHRLKVRKVSSDLIACSRSAADFFFGDAFATVIPNGINLAQYSFDDDLRVRIRERYAVEDKKIVGTIGRVQDEKNQKFLIDLLPRILQINPSVVLMIVGDGDLLPLLRAHAVDRGVSGQVIFAGSQSDVKSYLSAMDVFAFPSIFEGFGIALLEAQANGMPCVASTGVPRETKASDSIHYVSLTAREEWANLLAVLNRNNFADNRELMSQFDLPHVCNSLAMVLGEENELTQLSAKEGSMYGDLV